MGRRRPAVLRDPGVIMYGTGPDEWFGRLALAVEGAGAVAEMTSPVRCARCGGIYDLGEVEVLQRYLDCSTWKAPCCRALVSDQGEHGWGRPDYARISKGALLG